MKLENGTRVVKQNSEKGDINPDGSIGTIVSQLGPVDLPEWPGIHYFYFVVWDRVPGIPIGCIETKVRPLETRQSETNVHESTD